MELEILTPEEVAVLLRVDKETVYRNLRSGRLPGAKVGGQWRTRRADIDLFLASAPSKTLTQKTTKKALRISGLLSKD
jgi:excisionase family DNA binding protein